MLFLQRFCVPIDLEIGRQAGAYLRRFGKSRGVELGGRSISRRGLLHGTKAGREFQDAVREVLAANAHLLMLEREKPKRRKK